MAQIGKNLPFMIEWQFPASKEALLKLSREERADPAIATNHFSASTKIVGDIPHI